jgi:hypothetical protein
MQESNPNGSAENLRAKFREGDRVDITVKGASVDGVATDLNLLVINLTPDAPGGSAQALDLPLAENVTVEHASPAEWPPLPGDLWRDHDGDVWLVCMIGDGEVSALTMICAAGAADRSPEQLLTKFGPPTLVHREDEQDGSEAGR